MEDKPKSEAVSNFRLKILDKRTMHISIKGIQIDYTNKVISFDKSILRPQLTIVNGCKVISLFEKSVIEDLTQGNPLIQALKGENSWTIDHNKIIDLLSEFARTTDLLAPCYDTLLRIWDYSTVNSHFVHPLNQLIKNELYIKDIIIQFIEASEITTLAKIHDRLEFDFDDFDTYVIKMYEENDNKFSFKGLPEKWMYSFGTYEEWNSPEISSLKHANDINGKDILLLDVLYANNKLSFSFDELIKIFVPKSVTVVRLFPPDVD
jgi:hypothetical protein